MDERQNNTPDQYSVPSRSTWRRTWSQDMPALRLGRRRNINRIEQQRTATTGVATATITPDVSPPRFLRLIRFVVGVVLLGLAWVGILGGVMLVQTLTQPITHQHIITNLLFDAVATGATCLIGVTVLGCLTVGAFCLTLALTSRGWQ